MSSLYGKCPAQADLCLPQGQTWDTSFTWKIDDVGVDLTNYVARMMLRISVDAASPTVSLSTTAGTMSVNSAGAIVLNYPAVSTSSITAGNYLYDMELQSPNGNVRRLLQGIVVVSPEITR